MKVTFDKTKKHQTFEGFGASGAWWAQKVGGWTDIDTDGVKTKRDRISQLLFSKTDGIGLRTYRYNIGGGSAESGKGSYYDDARRAECFGTVGNYDFSRDKNAVYMLNQAVKDGADEVILFVNSPVESLTQNGMAQLGKHQIFRTNLKKKNYPLFADYCLDVTEHFVKEGVPIKYLSPVNEPLWIWNGGQEGCHYSPWQAGKVMKCFADKISERPALREVRLSGVENGDIRWFNKSYTKQMLKYPEVRSLVDSVDVHSYFTELPLPSFVNNRAAFLKRFNKWMTRKYPQIPVKMSEWTHMEGGRDSSMNSALVMAKTICEDITLLNVTSWQHWLACSPYDYCDGLIYLDLNSHNYEITKRYYVTGNFSKYIPFGAVRIEAKTDVRDILTVCFEKDNKYTCVFVNLSDKNESFIAEKDGKTAVTDDSRSLEESLVSAGDNISVPRRGVITYQFRG